jgi:adenosylmethionine-8-amino-7-oxononanoate aminotransferase
MAIQYWWNQSTVNSNHSKTARYKILALKNSYHGDTFGAMSVSERSVFTLAFQDLFFEVLFIDTPDEENIEELKTFIKKESSAIAAFIYEPLVQGAGGMKMYEAYWMNELLATVKEPGIICIADEVMTGFGRTGKMFASEYITVKPDILCMSKGLTGGTMALGATACTQKIYEAYVTDDKLKTFFHGHSFTANPLACTAGIASMELLKKDDCINSIEHISARNASFKLALLSNTKNIKNLRSAGTILAFEIDKGADEYLNNISSIITEKCLSKGVYLRPLGNTVYIMPPYCITDDELDKVYAVIEEVINDR